MRPNFHTIYTRMDSAPRRARHRAPRTTFGSGRRPPRQLSASRPRCRGDLGSTRRGSPPNSERRRFGVFVVVVAWEGAPECVDVGTFGIGFGFETDGWRGGARGSVSRSARERRQPGVGARRCCRGGTDTEGARAAYRQSVQQAGSSSSTSSRWLGWARARRACLARMRPHVDGSRGDPVIAWRFQDRPRTFGWLRLLRGRRKSANRRRRGGARANCARMRWRGVLTGC